MPNTITLDEYHDLTKPKNKYFAKRTEVDGIWFDSKKEAQRYLSLKILERCGSIKNLKLQPEFPLIVNYSKLGIYRADFSYLDTHKCEVIVEDCKGCRTPLYRWKKAHFEAQYGRRILET